LLTDIDAEKPDCAFGLYDHGRGSSELGYVCSLNSQPFAAALGCPSRSIGASWHVNRFPMALE